LPLVPLPLLRPLANAVPMLAVATRPVEALIAMTMIGMTMAPVTFHFAGIGLVGLRRRLVRGRFTCRRRASGRIRGQRGYCSIGRRSTPIILPAAAAVPALRSPAAFGPAGTPHLDHLGFGRGRCRLCLFLLAGADRFPGSFNRRGGSIGRRIGWPYFGRL
jgi:hypothetical protein